jgi:hypothetical protein
LVSRRTVFAMCASMLSCLIAIVPKPDASYDSLWSYFRIFSNFDVIELKER